MAKIAVLGMGAMGSRMAISLLKANHQVIVWNLLPSACDPVVALGATSATTPRQAADTADFVIAMVWDDQASSYVWLDENVGALAAMRKEAIALECATLTIEHERRLFDACTSRDIEFVSAPMAGSLPEADNRTLVFTVGATDKAFAKVEPILKAMGSTVNHAGQPLDGISEKLIINGKLAIEYAHAAEMVALDWRMGTDAKHRLKLRQAAPTFSARGIREAKFMLEGDRAVRVKVNQLIKDLSNQIQQLEAFHVPCPMHRAALTVLETARNQGYGDDDATVMAMLHRESAEEAEEVVAAAQAANSEAT